MECSCDDNRPNFICWSPLFSSYIGSQEWKMEESTSSQYLLYHFTANGVKVFTYKANHYHRLGCFSLFIFFCFVLFYGGTMNWWTMNDIHFCYWINLLYKWIENVWYVEFRTFSRVWSIEYGFIVSKLTEPKESHTELYIDGKFDESHFISFRKH